MGSDRDQQVAHLKRIRPLAPNLRHGITLPVDEQTIGLYEQRITEAAPHMAQARYAIARTLLARCLIRIDRVDLWYARTSRAWFIKSTASGKASVQTVEHRYNGLLEQARRLLESCGMTPSSVKALGLHVESPDALDPFRAEMVRQQQVEESTDVPDMAERTMSADDSDLPD